VNADRKGERAPVENGSTLSLKVCCPDAPCCDERPCLHLAFLTSREATVLRACLIRALNASQPDTRREVLQVPDPSDPSGGGSRQDRWTTTQMSRQVASAVIGEASLTVVRARWGFASEGRRARSRTTGHWRLNPRLSERAPLLRVSVSAVLRGSPAQLSDSGRAL
jgi:hypothetical protein